MTQIEYLATRSVIFKITVPNSSDVYMSAESSSDYEFDANRFVVVVNAKKFLQLWQNTGTDSNCGGIALKPNEWSNDYKYHWAVDGFSRGKTNPVPLAEVVASTNFKHSIHVERYFSNISSSLSVLLKARQENTRIYSYTELFH